MQFTLGPRGVYHHERVLLCQCEETSAPKDCNDTKSCICRYICNCITLWIRHTQTYQAPMVGNDLEIDVITEKLDSLSLKSAGKQCRIEEALNMDDEDENKDISHMSSCLMNGDLDCEVSSQEEMAKIKNDNYHLKLALVEKQEELIKMKRILEEKTFMENVHQFLPSKFEFAETNRGVEAMYLPAPALSQEAANYHESPTKKSASDSGFLSHISGSPYKGTRARSFRTESSLATTRISRLRSERKLVNSAIIPFVQSIINILKCSLVFKDEGLYLQTLFDECINSNTKDEDKLPRILNDLQFYCRQMVTLLNRELHFKEISQRLEFLFAIFLDPKEYDLQPQEHVDKLKDEIMDSLVRIFDYQADAANKISESKLKMTGNQVEMEKYYSNTDHSKKLRNIEEGIDLCAQAMQQTYGGRDGSGGIRLGTRKTHISSRPSTKSDIGILNPLPQFNNTFRERDVIRGTTGNLEFIPIGYDENILQATTPSRMLNKN